MLALQALKKYIHWRSAFPLSVKMDAAYNGNRNNLVTFKKSALHLYCHTLTDDGLAIAACFRMMLSLRRGLPFSFGRSARQVTLSSNSVVVRRGRNSLYSSVFITAH